MKTFSPTLKWRRRKKKRHQIDTFDKSFNSFTYIFEDLMYNDCIVVKFLISVHVVVWYLSYYVSFSMPV